MFLRDRTKMGDSCLRHENFKDQIGYTISNRRVEFANAIIAVDKYGHPVHRDSERDTVGDIQGATFIKKGDRPIGSWWHGCPVVKASGGFKPIRDRGFAPDNAYELIDAAVKDGNEVPEGSIGIIYAASKEDGEQELIFLGASGGVIDLLAPNANGPYELGTNVFDLDSQGKPDQNNFAKLQSAWIVMSPSYAPTSGSTGTGGNNFFAGAAVGDFGLCPGGLSLKPAESANANGGNVNVGILNGKPPNPFGNGNPFGGAIGLNSKGKLKFTQVEGDQGGFNPGSGLSGAGIDLGVLGPIPGGGSGGGSTGGGGGSGVVGPDQQAQNAAAAQAWIKQRDAAGGWGAGAALPYNP